MEGGWSGRELIFGGTFDPIHIGHLLAAEQAVSLYKFNKVIFVPAGNPWMKSSNIESAFHRLNMIKLEIKDNSLFEATDIEFGMQEPSFTIDTLDLLIKNNPQNEYSLIMGSDNIMKFDKWKSYKKILQNYQIYVYKRQGFVPKHQHENIILLDDCPHIKTSSSQIRELIRNEKDISHIVPKNIVKYLYKNNLHNVI